MSAIVPGLIRTYRGRPGCGCGCKGTYAEPNTKAAKARTRAFLRGIAAGESHIVSDHRDGETCIALESETRYIWLYFNSRKAAEMFISNAV